MRKNTSNFSFNEVEDKKEKVEDKKVEDKKVDEDYSNADQFMYKYDTALEDEDNFDDSTNGIDYNKKKLIKVMVFSMIGSLVIVLIIFIVSLFTGSKHSFEEIEVIMKNGAIDYFDDNKKDLPADETETSVIEVDSLVLGEYMKPLDKYLSNGVVCTGEVRVTKTAKDYYYKPFLDCGEDYISLTLGEKVIQSNTIVNGYGIFEENDVHYFRGQIDNNYLKLDNNFWRIVRINSDNTITLVLDNEYEYSGVWDNRYNTTLKNNSGINEYSISRVSEYLDGVFTNEDRDVKEALLSENDASKTVPFDLCIGKRDFNSVGKDNSLECHNKLENQNIGLLTASDFINASADALCTKPSDKVCQNYNYLVTKFDYWLVTADSLTTDQVYSVDRDEIELVSANAYSGFRPVVHLSSDVMFKSGDGTIESPYTIR